MLDIFGLVLTGLTVGLIAGVNQPSNPAIQVFSGLANVFSTENVYILLASVATLFFVAKAAISLLLNYLAGKFVARVESDLAASVYEEILEANLDKTAGLEEKDLLYAVSGSANMAFGQSLMVTSVAVGEAGLLVGVSVFLAMQSPVGFLVLSVYFGLFGFFMSRYVSGKTAQASARMQTAMLTNQGVFLDSLANLRQIKSLGTSSYFLNKFQTNRHEQASANAVMVNLGYLPRYITEIALMCGVGIVLMLRAISGVELLSTAMLAIFVAGAFRIIASMLPLAASLATLRRVDIEGKLASDLLGSRTRLGHQDLQSLTGALESSTLAAIECKNLTYSHPGTGVRIFENFSFALEQRGFLAIVGESGAGKSTLADLMVGLRSPDQGEVLVSGVPASIFVKANPGEVGYVPQRIELVSGTFAENIALGITSDDMDIEAIKLAIEKTELRGLVEKLPDGLNTPFGGASGNTLSGGELQRVGLARALYTTPSILVLDEPTSALDPETEVAINETLSSLEGVLTLVIIAHRPETIARARSVLTISPGRPPVMKQRRGSRAD